VKEVL